MSYLAEAHRSTGDVITAGIWNQAVSDNVAYLYNAIDVTGKVGVLEPFRQSGSVMTAFTANRIYLTKWLLPRSLTMNYFTLHTRGGSANSNVGLGLYSLTGALLARSDATNCPSTDAGYRLAVSGTSALVTSQWVWLAATADAALIIEGCPFTSDNQAKIFNEHANDIQTGYTSTVSAVGVLPATIVVTGLTGISGAAGPHGACFAISCI